MASHGGSWARPCMVAVAVYFMSFRGLTSAIDCFECINYVNGVHYSHCPKDQVIDTALSYKGSCDGACFTKDDVTDDKVVVRGCTSTQGTLPNPLPPDGCYTWNLATFCLCRSDGCNQEPLGNNSGQSLDAHLLDEDVNSSLVTDGGILQCYQCSSYAPTGTYNPQCPKDGLVNRQTVYIGDCIGACYTRDIKDYPKPNYVVRGCTGQQYGLPLPLPADGCYDHLGDTWCVCSHSACNGQPLGASSGVAMDAHLTDSNTDVEEPDGVHKCYQCLNYDKDGNFYPQCEKNSRVRNAYAGACNGSCFTRSFDYDDKLVARGCTETQWGLPDPLPPDGCYPWYSEVWCVCSGSRCNGAALGEPGEVEFDAHIHNKNSHFNLRLPNKSLVGLALLLHLGIVIPNGLPSWR